MATIETQPETVSGAWERAHGGVSLKRGFYMLAGKRIFDSVIAALGLVLLSPLLLLTVAISKLSSRGPIFYRQDRVGKGGQTFSIVKFRTMTVNADQTGPGITVRGDQRITTFGRALRSLKIDELPQLWNVVKGEMSLVGPRPELPCYVAGYNDLERNILSIRPGITDAASLLYRHEEQVLARASDPEKYYRNIVLPHKLTLNLEYLSRASFVYDLSLIFRTLGSLFRAST